MDRADAVEFLEDQYGKYLGVVKRLPQDTAGNLKGIIDAAFRALGVASADLTSASTDDEESDEDLRVQVAYRAMLQIVRDLGATAINVSLASGDSFSLNQIRAAAEKDLAEAKAAVLARFGTLGMIGGDGDELSGFLTIDTNYRSDLRQSEIFG